MGNYRFKLSDMIPNAWFYKLRDMGRKGKARKYAASTTTSTTFSKNKKLHPPSTTITTTTTTNSPKPKQQCSNSTTPRKSYYFTRELNQISSKINHTSPRRLIISDNNNKSNCSPQEQPRKSSCSSIQRPSSRSRRRRRTHRISSPKLVTSSVSAGCSCRTTPNESVWTKSDSHHHHHHHHDYSSLSPSSSSSSQFGSSGDSEEAEFRTDHVLPTETSSFDEMVSLSTTTNTNNSTSDIVIDVDKNSLPRKDDKLQDHYDSFSDLDLPPIITKTPKPNPRIEKQSKLTKGSLKVKIVKEDTAESIEKKQRSNTNASSVKGFSVSSPGVKLRINSPRLVGGRRASNGRKSVSLAAVSSGYRRSLSESFAVVKSSCNPQKDFRESMVEMIVENNIRASKDLEDLLACYLSLNSDEYHELIITVFKQIWFDLTEKR